MGLRSKFRNANASANEKQLETKTPPFIFSIHEIIEKILLEVPAIDVLTNCRAVCRTWKVLIEVSSPDLKYYSLSGLKRPRGNPSKQNDPTSSERAGPSKPAAPGLVAAPMPSRPLWAPPAETFTQPDILVTPLAMEVLGIFWKKLVKRTASNYKIEPRTPPVDKKSRHIGRKLFKAAHCGAKSYDSSRESGFFWTSTMCIGFFIILPIYTPIYWCYDKGLRRLGPTARKYRSINNFGITLMKEFRPIWKKIHIFNPQDPKGTSIFVGAHTNWRSRDESWRYDLDLGSSFDDLPAGALALMTPLIETVFSRRPAAGSYMWDGSDVYDSSAVVIDLKRESGGVNRATRYVDNSPRELIVFRGGEPFDVSRHFGRPGTAGFGRISDRMIWI
ncbi:hypothetical protein TWF281_011378 [Arthrobotrys megalospora]